MKSLLLLFLGSFIFTTATTQDLTGLWTGTSYFGNVPLPSFINSVTLEFKLNPDSSYTILSYSQVRDTLGKTVVAACNVRYKRKSKTRLVLEETKLITALTVSQDCFQKFDLKIKEVNNSLVLIGQYSTENCSVGGSIVFTKDP